MGNPDRYYKMALQAFAHSLVCMDNLKMARELFEEKSEEKLEKFILQKKEQIEEKTFYYNAGMACQYVLEEANREGCDAFNASIGGLNEFEYFIGIQEDEED